MSRRMVVGCVLVLMVAASVWAGELVFDIPKLDNITIDGDISDWGDRGFYVGLLADETRSFKEASDFDGRLWLGWDDQGLLVRAEGRDDQHVEHPEDWSIWAMDAVELFMAVEPGSQDRYQIVVAPGHTKEQPDLRIQYYEFRKSDALSGIKLTGDAAATRVGDRYVLEVRMPWSNLALKPHMGMTCGFQIYLNDYDPDDPSYLGRYTAMWYPGGQSNWYPERMYRLRLADAPSAPVLAMGTVRAFSEVSMLWVEVNAVEALVGRELTITGPNLKETTVTLAPYQGRAVGRTYLAANQAGYDPEAVNLTIVDEPVSNVARETGGLPTVDFDVAREQDGGYVITPHLQPVGAFPADKKAKVLLYDEHGAKLRAFSLRPGESTRIQLGEGLYLLTGRYPAKFGHTIEGGRGFAVGLPEDLQERLSTFQAAEVAARKRFGDAFLETYEGYWRYSLDVLRICMEERPNDFSANESAFIEWFIRPQVDPKVLYGRRGKFEWAHRSPVDGSGQPFTVWLPYDYDGKAPIRACLWLHGSGGAHKELRPMPDTLVVSVLGRGRQLGYGALCGVDVLEVYDYITHQWNVDLDRVGIFGASMGGYGTYQIASEHPDLFSAVSPWMGGGGGIAVENLIDVPVYAMHGTHDDRVPIGQTRLALERIDELGGMTMLDVMPKVAHGFTTESEARGEAWVRSQVRTDQPKRIHFKALHNGALGAYGVKVVEWGSEWRPATFDAVREGDVLYLTLDNIRILEVGLAGIARVSVNQGLYIDVPGPDNGAFYVVLDDEARVVREKPALPEQVLNTPGGPYNLYHGDPLLVVWGTQADEETNRRILDVADRMRRSSQPTAPKDDSGGNHNFMMHGKLRGKADTEVTDDDLRNYSLVLLGTADQNSVVKRLADALPVQLNGDTLQTDDGVAWSAKDRGWAFAYYNPMAPQRRLLWVASQEPGFYHPETAALSNAWDGERSADLMLASAEGTHVVAERRFDTRWQWAPSAAEYLNSPLLPAKYCTKEGFAKLRGKAILEQTNAAGTVLSVQEPPEKDDEAGQSYDPNVFAPGVTRVADVALTTFWEPLMQLTFSADEMAEMPEWIANLKPDGEYRTVYLPGTRDAGSSQRLILRDWDSWSILTNWFEWSDRVERAPFDFRDVLLNTLSGLK